MFEPPRVLAWELTKSCPLKCRHCRASSATVRCAGELSREECLAAIATCPAKLIIWTGGEPMIRDDLEELVRAAAARGIRSVMAPCGMMVTKERLERLKVAGVSACSFSVDGPTREMHDAWRGVDGAWDGVMRAISCAREAGMPFQVNCVVSRITVDRLGEMQELAAKVGATRLDLFFLVPTGRAVDLGGLLLSREEMDEVRSRDFSGLPVHFTCHPAGCMGGRGFAFISAYGELQMCGFCPKVLGSLRECGFDMGRLFSAVREVPPVGACRVGYQGLIK